MLELAAQGNVEAQREVLQDAKGRNALSDEAPAQG